MSGADNLFFIFFNFWSAWLTVRVFRLNGTHLHYHGGIDILEQDKIPDTIKSIIFPI